MIVKHSTYMTQSYYLLFASLFISCCCIIYIISVCFLVLKPSNSPSPNDIDQKEKTPGTMVPSPGTMVPSPGTMVPSPGYVLPPIKPEDVVSRPPQKKAPPVKKDPVDTKKEDAKTLVEKIKSDAMLKSIVNLAGIDTVTIGPDKSIRVKYAGRLTDEEVDPKKHKLNEFCKGLYSIEGINSNIFSCSKACGQGSTSVTLRLKSNVTAEQKKKCPEKISNVPCYM